VGFWWKKGH